MISFKISTIIPQRPTKFDQHFAVPAPVPINSFGFYRFQSWHILGTFVYVVQIPCKSHGLCQTSVREHCGDIVVCRPTPWHSHGICQTSVVVYCECICVCRHRGLLPTNSFSFTSSGFGSRVFLYVNILSTIGRFIIWSILWGGMVSVGVTKKL